MSLIKLSLLLFFGILIFSSANSDLLIVTDGDTIRIGDERIRFSGIDAPEIKQTCIYQEIEFKCGEFSKNLLIEKISNQEVSCIRESTDQYGRTLAECFVKGENVKLSSFGTFSVRSKKERIGRNPKTGIEARISPRRVISFHPSISLRKRVNK